jgi:hypothetical protein
MKRTLTIAYRLGQKVRVIHDPDHLERMVTQVLIGPNGVRYALSCGEKETTHYPMEIEAVEAVDIAIGFKVKFLP